MAPQMQTLMIASAVSFHVTSYLMSGASTSCRSELHSSPVLLLFNAPLVVSLCSQDEGSDASKHKW